MNNRCKIYGFDLSSEYLESLTLDDLGLVCPGFNSKSMPEEEVDRGEESGRHD